MGWMQLFDQEKNRGSAITEVAQKILVLIIDDEIEITNTLKRYLTLENYPVITANSGLEGYRKYQDEKPQVIITDIRMPQFSGLELLRKIRAEDQETEIIVVTGQGDLDSAIEALKFQASDFILKPFDLEVILISLERAVERLQLKQKVRLYTDELERLLRQVNYSKKYLETLVQNSPSALLTYELNGVITSWNEQAEQITGYSTSEAMGKSLNALFALEGPLIDESAEQQGRVFQNIISQIVTKAHTIRFISRNANVIRNEENTAIGGIESFIDISERIKSERLLEKRYLQVQTINEIGKQVAGSSNLVELCDFISNRLVTTFFESSHVTLFFYNELMNKLQLTAMFGQQIERIKQRIPIGSYYDIDHGVIGHVFSSGQAQLCEDVTACPFFREGTLPQAVSEFAFPIRSKDRIFGVLNIENAEKMQLDESDMFMLEAIAEYLGISAERLEMLDKITHQNQLLEKQAADLREALYKVASQKEIIEKQNDRLLTDLKKAAEFQKSLLPVDLPELPEVKFAASYVPSSQLGGDFYDIFQITDDTMGMIVTDASGHGVAAAMLSAMFKMTLHKYASEILDPARVLELLNKDFCKVLQMGEFFTAFYAIFDHQTKRMVYCNAAHPKPLLLDYDSGQSVDLDSEGFLLGVMDKGIPFEQKELILNGNFRLLIFTDGVNETMNPDGEQFGEGRIRQGLLTHAAQDRNEYLNLIKNDLAVFSGSATFEDDVTLVVMDVGNVMSGV